MKEGLNPSKEFKGSAYEASSRALPRHFLDSVKIMRKSSAMKDILGEAFVETYLDAKEMEYDSYTSVLSPWEAKYLLLNV